MATVETPAKSLFPMVEAAGRIGVSLATLNRLIGQGKIDCVRVGARRRITMKEITRILEQGTGGDRK